MKSHQIQIDEKETQNTQATLDDIQELDISERVLKRERNRNYIPAALALLFLATVITTLIIELKGKSAFKLVRECSVVKRDLVGFFKTKERLQIAAQKQEEKKQERKLSLVERKH